MNNNENRPSAASQPEYPQNPYYEDEINLIDIWRVLVKQRKWIIITTALVLSIAVAYALMAQKVYQAEAIILPPSPQNVEQLKKVSSVYQITGTELYNQFLVNLKARKLRRQFFKKNNILAALQDGHSEEANAEEVFKGFNKLLQIKAPKKGNGSTTATLTGKNAAQIAKWLNDFIRMADTRTIAAISKAIESSIKIREEALNLKIKGLRTIARLRRLDKIKQLKEAILIADKLGLREPMAGMVNKKRQAGSLNLATVLNTTAQPLYLRGSKALKAELGLLEKRKNDDPFIPSLRYLQEQLLLIKGVEFNPANLHALRLDQPAYPPQWPTKPKRRLIVALGLILGLMLGVFIAFIINFVATNRLKLSTDGAH